MSLTRSRSIGWPRYGRNRSDNSNGPGVAILPDAGAPYASHPVPFPFSYPPWTTRESGSDAFAKRGWPLGWCERSAQVSLPSWPARLLPHAHRVPSATRATV